jgi:hypothetical protein
LAACNGEDAATAQKTGNLGAGDSAPTISGTPATSTEIGATFSFTPSATDVDGDTLAFSISGKPAWATFSPATGALTGTAQAGSWPDIVITVTDGKNSRALPAFALNVGPPSQGRGTGTATLRWSAPTQNTDGTALPSSELAGYRVYHGTSADALTEVTDVRDTGAGAYTFNQLASGTHYFAVTAYNRSGVESALSGVGSKTIM